MKSIVYLACPYSHEDEAVRLDRFKVANRVAGWMMKEKGLFVFSPISHTHPIIEAVGGLGYDFKTWEEYDRAFIRCCSALYVCMAGGWKESVGVTAEIAIAKELGLPVYHILPAGPPEEWSI